MLLFGHTGITAGVVKACDILVSMTKPGNSYQPDSSSKFTTVSGRQRLRLHYLFDGIEDRLDSIDYRVILFGSLLPDIVDKPVWFLVTSFASDASLGGRDYTHSLLFNLVLFTGGLVLVRYGKSWLLIISLSSFMHLILDRMWNRSVVLLWPLLGPFPGGETVGWVSGMFQALFSYPEIYIPEIIGLVVVLLFAYRLVMKKRVISFIKDGAIG